MSSTTARISHNQSQVVKPTPGDHKITYINVVNGRKMMPRIGHNQLPPKAALNMAGRASQMSSVPMRGKNAANIANKQTMLEILLEKCELLVPSEKRPSMDLIL